MVAKLTETAIGIEYIRNYIFKKARDQVMKMSGGLYPAPLKVSQIHSEMVFKHIRKATITSNSFVYLQILDVIRTGVEKGPTAGYESERKAFGELSATPQSKGLIGLFRGQTECKKNRFGNPPKPAKTIGVLGAGKKTL